MQKIPLHENLQVVKPVLFWPVFWFIPVAGNSIPIFFIYNYLTLLIMENQDSSPKALMETAEEYASTKVKLIKL